MKEDFKKRLIEAQADYKRNMLSLFKEAGIPESEFVEPARIESVLMFKVKLTLSESTVLVDSAYLADGAIFKKYKFSFSGSTFVVGAVDVYYYCDTLEEAQSSYSPKEVLSVSIEEEEMLSRKDKQTVYYQ